MSPHCIVIESHRMGTGKIVAGMALAGVIGAGTLSQTQTQAVKSAAGGEACSGCHSEIYKSYSKTVMANASGLAADGVIAGEFRDKTSGVRYRVYTQEERSQSALGPSGSETRTQTDQIQTVTSTSQSQTTQAQTSQPNTHVPTVWMSYERASEKFQGQRQLLYFIGSGRKGRSYLFSVQGFLFEAPINWYSQENHWGMTPAHAETREIPMNLPAFPDCINCHGSGLQAPVAGTENEFTGPPFLHGGITCQRCHGEGEGHGVAAATFSSSSNATSGKSAAGRRLHCESRKIVAGTPGRDLHGVSF